MKNLIWIIVSIIIGCCSTFIFPQETLKPFIVSPLIGEKLDRIEEDYFGFFPVVADFHEATFYMNPDSSLLVNIKGYYHNALIDTTFRYSYSLSNLRERINQVVMTDINENKVQNLEFVTEDNKSYEGTVYSFNNDQIKLIKRDFTDFDYQKDPEEYFPEFSISHLQTITIHKSSTAVIIAAAVLGTTFGALVGAALGPKILSRGEGWFDFRDVEGGILGGILGGLLGFGAGSIINVPDEYDARDADSRRIIRENSLLQSGLQ